MAQGKIPNVVTEIYIMTKTNQHMPLPQINQNYEIKAKGFNDTDRTYIMTFVKWLYSICGECETKTELDYSLNALDCWLVEQKNVSSSLREFTADYLEKSFKTQSHKLCQCYFQHLYGGNLGSNSISEQENSALKRDHMGPRPNSGIDRSLIATTSHETRRLKQMRRNVLQSLSQTLQDEVGQSDEDSDSLEVEDDVLNSEMQFFPKEELSNDLIDHALKDVRSQYEASKNYLYYHAPGSNEFLVRRVTWQVPQTDTPETIYHAYVPKFDRTRTVIIENRKYAYHHYVNFIFHLSLIILCCMKSA